MDQSKTAPPKFTFNPFGAMQAFGTISLIVGIVWGVWAYQMDTTVGTTHNIGLIAEQQKNLVCAGLMTISGVLLLGFGSLGEMLSSKHSDVVARSAGGS